MRNLQIVFVLLVITAFGVFVGQMWQQHSDVFLSWFEGDTAVYHAMDGSHESEVSTERLGWAALLPKSDAVVLDKFQSPGSLSFSDQVTRSIEAGSSQQYRASLYSTDIVDGVLNKRVSLPGFIVPLALEEARKVSSFFIVPYFGACIHYPPPPPNQMVYVSLPHPTALPDINEPYLFTGVLRDGLFEDLLGTSAYIMEVDTVSRYFDDPDDVRDHEGQQR